MNYIYDYSRLRGLIAEKFRTRCSFAKEIGISGQSLSLKLSNKIGFKQKEINIAIKILEIPKEKIGDYFFVLDVN